MLAWAMAVAPFLSWFSLVFTVWMARAWWSAPLMLAMAAPMTAADRQGGELCSPTLCGGVSISFPFGIVADQATETNCGAIGFQVLCSNNTPYFRGSSQLSPRILDIFYHNNSLLIANLHKLQVFNSSASNGCHSPHNNISAKIVFPFSISSVNQNLIFYDCEEPPTQAVRQSRGLVDTACGNRTLVGVTKGPDVPGTYYLEGCNTTFVPMLARSGEVNPANYKEFISDGYLLTWQLPQPSPSPSPSAAGKFCSPMLCGGVSISFPFGIVADNATDTTCGVIGFQVCCYNNTPYFGLSSSKYLPRIVDIFYDNSSLLNADVHKLDDFNRSATNGCHSPSTNSSDKIVFPFSISPVNQNLIFYGCVEPPTEAERRRLGLVDTACGNKTLVGVTRGPDVPGSYFLEGCSATVVPMLPRSGEVNSANYKEIIRSGFLLTWQLPPPSPSPSLSPAGMFAFGI